MLDLDQLRSFAEVAERGTVAAAAAAVGYTGPAVSQHVAKLEAQLGLTLFDRVGGRLRLSPAGAALLPIALDMLELAGLAGRLAPVEAPADPVVLAGFASALTTLVVPALAPLRETVELVVREAEDADALRELALGHVDVVLIQEYDGVSSPRPNRFRYHPLLSDRLRLVAPPGRPRTSTLAELADEAWLVNGERTRCTEATRAILGAAGVAPRVAAVVADNDALLRLVAAGHGVTIVPEQLLDGRRDAVTVCTTDLGAHRTTSAVTRRRTGPAVEAVLTELARVADRTR